MVPIGPTLPGLVAAKAFCMLATLPGRRGAAPIPRRRRGSITLVLAGPSSSRPGCQIAFNSGSDSLLVVSGLHGADDAGLEEIEVSAAIHLAFDKLELRDLPLGLPVRPG